MEAPVPTSMANLQCRIEARDLKLSRREEFLASEHPGGLRVCKCNICREEKKSLRRTHVVREHLRKYGRAPFLRGSTNVSFVLSIYLVTGFP
jgi:hypothetical protein